MNGRHLLMNRLGLTGRVRVTSYRCLHRRSGRQLALEARGDPPLHDECRRTLDERRIYVVYQDQYRVIPEGQTFLQSVDPTRLRQNIMTI